MNTKPLEPLKEVSGIGDSTLDDFRDYGFKSLDDLKGISRSELKDVPGVGAATANSILRLLEREGLRTKSMRTERQESFQELLRELFKFDMADLDFGIYRIMNHKRKEIAQFIDEGLLDIINEEFESFSEEEASRKEEKLGQLKAEIREDLGEEAITPEGELTEIYQHTPLGKRYEALKREIEEEETSDPVEVQVFNDLINFFKFYYDEGDFVTKRRYSREQKYAVPYNGEEVYLHWANKEQYYVKTGEQFKDYEFRLPGDYHVSFELKNAEDELNNQKGEDKFYLLHRHDPIHYEPGERTLTVQFEHRPLDDLDMDDYELSEKSQKRTWKKNIKGKIVEQVLETTEGKGDLHNKLTAKERGEEKTTFEKHLDRYTQKHEADYFIHKELGDFLRRELDFYIKNEIVDLDALGTDDERDVDEYLSRVRVMKKIAHRIIDFLAQIEDFQRDLFEKKKFVVQTDYLVTIDQVSGELYDEILDNEAQIEQWKEVYNIDEWDSDLTWTGTFDELFIENHPHIMVDTGCFDDNFKARLLASFEDIEEALDGVLFNSENFQALQLMSRRFHRDFDCVYIDPPYNTDASPIMYKNGYKSSTWTTMMNDRVQSSRSLLTEDGVLVSAIDDEQQPELSFLLSEIFDNRLLGTICVRSNPSGRPTQTGYSVTHEYLLFAGESASSSIGRMPPTEEQMARFSQQDDEGPFEWRNLRREGSDSNREARPKLYYPIYVTENGSIRVPQMTWNEQERKWDIEEDPEADEQIVWPTNEEGEEKRWRWDHETVMDSLSRLGVRKDRSGRDYVYYKRRPHDEGVVTMSSWFDAKYSATEHGTAVIKDLFGESVFSYPKSVHAVVDAIYVSGGNNKDATVLDYFAGSGTTAHAVINLNREDNGSRRFVLAEMGEYFDNVLKPRIQKVVLTDNWDDGKPQNKNGISQMVKYQRLEQYEDTLNNIAFRDKAGQVAMDEFDDYLLNYMLEFETTDSPSRLNVDKLTRPFEYELKIKDGDETERKTIDLVETFNYILGLKVSKTHLDFDEDRKYRIVKGRVDGEKVSIVWRNTDDLDSEEDLERDKKFIEERLLDGDEDRVYANGVCSIEDVKSIERTFKPAIGA